MACQRTVPSLPLGAWGTGCRAWPEADRRTGTLRCVWGRQTDGFHWLLPPRIWEDCLSLLVPPSLRNLARATGQVWAPSAGWHAGSGLLQVERMTGFHTSQLAPDTAGQGHTPAVTAAPATPQHPTMP